MAWSKMSEVPNPIFDTNGNPYSGAVLKAYLPGVGSTTVTSIATDKDGSNPQSSITANADGIWEVSGNEIIPHIGISLYKWGIFANSTDAAADTPFYMGPFDDVEQVQSSGSGAWALFSATPTQTSTTTFQFTDGTDHTSSFPPKTRVQLTDSTTLYDTVVSSSYSSPNTTVTVETGGLTGSLSAVYTSIADVTSKPIGTSAISYSNFNIPNATGDLTELINRYGLVLTLIDPSAGDGATDASPAFKKAIAFINDTSPFTRKLIVPNGVYDLQGEVGDDGLRHGIHVPFSGRGYRHTGYSLMIEFESHEAILQDGIGLDKIIRWSACNSFAKNGQLKGDATNTVDGLSLTCSDESSTSLGAVGQSYNTFENFYIEGCKNARRIRCSQSAGSTAFFNKFLNFRTRFGTLPEVLITNVTATNPATITTNVNHGYSTSDIGYFYGSGVGAIDGIAHTMTVTASNELTIPVDGTGWTSGGTITSGEGGRVFLVDWVSGDYSPCNRNYSSGDIFNEVNTGFETVVADTNIFANWSGEGVQYGTSPNNIPTLIKDHSSALSSAFNRYLNGTAEAIARNLDVNLVALIFDNVVFDQVAHAADNLPAGYPSFMVNCGSAATYAYRTQAFNYNRSGSLNTEVGGVSTAPLELQGYPVDITINDGSGDEDIVYITPGNLDHKGGFAAGRHNTTYTSGGGHAIRSYANAVDSYVETVGHNVADTTRVITVHVLGSDRMAVDAIGNGYWDGTHDGSPADYAEYFEWIDGNPYNDDRVGLTVVSESGKIRLSRTGDSARDIIGVVSARPIIVGDSDSLGWQGKYITDDYGRRISDKINPDYDPDIEHKPRSDRSEWDAIGLVGKLYVDKGQCVGDRWILLKEGEIDKPDLWLVR